MVILTLYKNCKLNSEYNQVFCPTLDENKEGYIDKYLLSLPKKTIELGNTYLPEPSGQFIIDYYTIDESDRTTILNYNYIMIKNYTGYDAEEMPTENIKRFAFITKIDIINEQVIINYSIDVWHSYSPYMRIQNSLLISTNNLQVPSLSSPISYYHLPIDYTTTNGVNIKHTQITDSNNWYRVICKIQYYKTVQSGNISNRHTAVVELRRLDSNLFWYYKKQDIDTIISSVLYSSEGNNFTINSNKYSYEILNIYLIPSTIAPILSSLDTIGKYKLGQINIDTENLDVFILGNTSAIEETSNKYLLNKLVDRKIDGSNFKIKSVGTLNTQIGVDISGSDKKLSVYFQLSEINFNLYMSVNGEMIDITKDFELELPLSVETADVTQLKAISRSTNTIINTMQSLSGVSNGIGSIVSGLGNALESVNYVGKNSRTGQLSSGGGSIITGLTDIGTSIAKGIYNDQLINAKAHVSNTSIKVNDNAIANAYYGICEYEIIPDNENEVRESIKLMGYSCAKLVNNIFEDLPVNVLDYKMSNIKFGYINITGAFPQNIQKELSRILLKGVRVFYTNEVINV